MSARLLLNVNVAWFFLSHRLAVARAARAAGFEVHVAAAVDSPSEAELIEREGIELHRVRIARGGLSPHRDAVYAGDLARVMHRLRPRLLHNVSVKPIVYGSLIGRALGVPRIVNAVSGLGYSFSGGSSRRLTTWLVARAYRLASSRRDIRFIFQNRDDIETFLRSHLVRAEQVVLIRGSGVDLDAFACSEPPTGTPRVVLPARMLADKGVREFAAAARMLRDRGVHADFLLAGMIDEANPAALSREAVLELARESGAQYLGHVTDMAALYCSVHIVCLPSYREGLPKALLEACAAGRPIVATDVPGCREAVTDGVNGLLVAPRDPQALADALERLLRDPETRARMGRAARRKAETEFDVRAVVAATLELYREMLN